ncbi:MAG: transposase [Verrucomicrobia bacterium]|nr:transposase [Verrucomicrobiota bacterium]
MIAREGGFSPRPRALVAANPQLRRTARRPRWCAPARHDSPTSLRPVAIPQAEAQPRDRLSFRGLSSSTRMKPVPDESTICRFRQRLIDCGLHEQLLICSTFNSEARGYIVKRTTLVDATLIPIQPQTARTRKPPAPGQA